MSKCWIGCVLAATFACSAPTAKELDGIDALVGDAPRTFVLNAAENQRGEWIVTFDHQCDGVHSQTRARHEIVLEPDGAARWERWVQRLRDGTVSDSTYLVSTGRWIPNSGHEVVLRLKSEFSGEFDKPLRILGSTSFSSRSPMGGACKGSPDDSRVVDFIYTTR